MEIIEKDEFTCALCGAEGYAAKGTKPLARGIGEFGYCNMSKDEEHTWVRVKNVAENSNTENNA